MKKLLYGLLLSLIAPLYGNQHGLVEKTLIQKADGGKVAIEQLEQNDTVTCQGGSGQTSKSGRITAIQKQMLSHYYELVCDNGIEHEKIVVAPDQQLFDVVRQTFLNAEEIHKLVKVQESVVIASRIGDSSNVVESSNYHRAIIVDSFEVNDPAKAVPFYAVTVDDCHTFQIGPNGYVAHNFGFLIALAFGAGEFALDAIGISIFGAAATYTASRIIEQQRSTPDRYWEQGQIVYSNPNPPTPPTPPTPPNNNKNGDPEKPNGGNGNGGNGLKPEDIITISHFAPEDRDKKNEEVFFENNIQHIFRKDKGHLPDTSENRQMLNDLVSNEGNWVGKDQHGNTWYAKDMPDGTQQWAWTRDGKIRDGGLNEFKLEWDPNTGFCSPKRPGK